MHLREQFFRHLAQTSPAPLGLEIERAEGCWLYDTAGNRYLDLIAGIGVSSVGHRHPAVLAAIHGQLGRYLHTLVYGELVLSPQVRLATALAETLRPYRTAAGLALDNVYLTNSGTEAIEGAMKLAKRLTGRTGFVACHHAYHGATQGALSLAGAEFFRQAFRPLLPGVRHIRHGQTADLKHITEKTAAVVIEIVSAEAGVSTAENAYWAALQARCRQTGTLVIVDEVQTGFGRTGTFWAFGPTGLVPDVLVAAKGMGGGMPIGAFIAPKSLMQAFTENPVLGHITTFGGHPVSAAASLATLQVILEEKLIEQVPEKAAFLRGRLVHPRIRAVRQAGLLMAVEFRDFSELKAIIDAALRRGLLTDWFLFCDNALRIAPPLTITLEELDWACQVLLEAIDGLEP